MQRYFLTEPYSVKEYYTITGDNYHHIVRVMRMEPGQQVFLAFSDCLAIIAEITEITEEVVCLKEICKEQSEKELPVNVTIACGYPKGDKLEWVVQKGTELGSHKFIGFPAKASVVKWDHKKLAKKTERLKKIATEAAEQSHRQFAPDIVLLEREQELLDVFSGYDKVLIAYEESAKIGERSRFATALSGLAVGESVLIIFGPEGGFSPAEVDLFQEYGGIICGLGPRILRAETAPLYVLSAISYQFELV
ncbi:RsmE family RNA methyltransferase [Enterococcus haemoperoxidus ATCC BAA-382]|uniref:Ribosomal RNA small subunit methyltransferase E n=1 Tax=Enterococcus haemoperoxidus ATCC BAA-382 TaxID=1158608 RepID=R2QC79_9ENTE|nr:16S rRNA (uracil(1498)-N(3))-methyltransferase [Enterococcus haemoperoxidus]EOH92848.1 RsmE family RNA methyltransferase [Enterococcus haemoperoxidus ATCC BAA-382]EOT61591.1 16S rRNA (-N3)-methyltransferase [Enterococcus haemoperoxidus ATCC BAA-382]OJG55424.1 RsmE family RNA methyltransferase [Enterococcus haemoperoxidus]